MDEAIPVQREHGSALAHVDRLWARAQAYQFAIENHRWFHNGWRQSTIPARPQVPGFRLSDPGQGWSDLLLKIASDSARRRVQSPLVISFSS